MKKTIFLSLAFVATAATAQLPTRIETFPISSVRLGDSQFLKNQQTDIHYLLGLDADRLLAPYLKEAGLTPKAENYTNWENTGLDGHIGGHYLSALSYMLAATGNKEIEARLDYVLDELRRCQNAAGDGYLCGVPGGRKIWKEIAEGNIRAASFGLNDRWVPLYNIHKIYAGLRDACEVAGRVAARQMLVRLTDWMVQEVSQLSDSQIQQMLASEHGGLNETFADVANITGNRKYLKLAHQFSDERMLQPLLKGEDNLTGKHANTQIPKVIGFKRIADLEGLEDWDRAARFFWDVVIGQRSVSIGGNSMREHFNPTNDFSGLLASEQGPESCNTYNMLRLTKMLYQTSADKDYMDYYERALYNHILSILNPVQGGFVYFTPMRSGHYRVYSQPQTSMWCCVGTGLENPARYGEMVYAHEADNLLVNLFIPSTLTWGDLTVKQENHFPQEPSTNLTIGLKKARKFSIKIRQPWWTEGMTVTVNGTAVGHETKDGYVVVTRKWSDGDLLHVETPMHLTAMTTPDGRPQYSFLYGPIVLAAKTGTDRQDGLFADDSRGGHIANGPKIPATQMPALIGQADEVLKHLSPVDGKPLTFRLSGVTLPQYEGLTLVPFYQLYECRYQIYFPLYTEAEWTAKQQEIAAEEKAKMELEARTVDKIFCGEQQSESDHFFSDGGSWNGSDEGTHWRRTRSHFSYQMKADGARTLRLKGFADRERMVVSLEGKPLGTVNFDRDGTATIELPADVKDTVTLSIGAEQGKQTPRLSEVRLCR
ncbi:MAG: glycoside hydrolase family 127 protein [Prevotella sp.]|nr:glycoside hydrolase family 127 protein [Prevotella sp.]MBQ8487998.1 glycoside hydrolase family 127 protein [Prevotella sp.]